MKRVPIVVLASIVAFVAATAWLSDRPAPGAAASAAVADPNLQTTVFIVDHMTCATCPITVKTAIAAVAGVASVEVDFESKRATVTFDPAKATPARIAGASTNAGYPASPVSQD